MAALLSLFAKGLLWTTVAHHSSSDSDSHNLIAIPYEIPSSGNFTLCSDSRMTDLYDIDEIEVHPWPPLIGQTLSFVFYGTFLKNITENATWAWNVVHEDTGNHDNGVLGFCEIMEHIEQPNRKKACPPEKGFALITVHTWVPSQPWIIGEGNYSVRFDAKTKEGERIYCIENQFELLKPDYGESRINSHSSISHLVLIEPEKGKHHAESHASGDQLELS